MHSMQNMHTYVYIHTYTHVNEYNAHTRIYIYIYAYINIHIHPAHLTFPSPTGCCRMYCKTFGPVRSRRTAENQAVQVTFLKVTHEHENAGIKGTHMDSA